jgi:hypothetical protein
VGSFIHCVAKIDAQEPHEQDDRVDRHDGGGDALCEPVAQTVVRADDETLRADLVTSCHF